MLLLQLRLLTHHNGENTGATAGVAEAGNGFIKQIACSRKVNDVHTRIVRQSTQLFQVLMKIRPVVVEFTSDNGQRIAGPWPLPLTPDQRRELETLAREYGPITKENSSAKD